MRFAPLALAFAAVAVVGCGSSEQAASADAGVDQLDQLKIGVSVPAASHGWTAGVIWWAERAMALYPEVEWEFETASTNAEQEEDIRAMLVEGVDGIVVLANESAPLTPVAAEIKERGVFLVNVDRGFTEPHADIFIEGDNVAFGRISAEYMVEALGGQGRIVVLRGMPSTVDSDRVNAALEVFDAAPGIEVLGVQPGNWNKEDAYAAMSDFLVRFPEIDAVWASDDDMAEGVEQALIEAGRENDMWVLGGAGKKEIVKRVMDGDPLFPANVTYPPSMIATGIELAVANLRDGNLEAKGEFMPRHMKINVELVTPENAERFYFPDSVF